MNAMRRALSSTVSRLQALTPRSFARPCSTSSRRGVLAAAAARARWGSWKKCIAGAGVLAGIGMTTGTVLTAISMEKSANSSFSLPAVRYQPVDVVLYQYEVCPFCCKVKAFLNFCNIPYRVVEVNPLFKKEIAFSDYKKVPFIVINGKQLKESDHIIDELVKEFGISRFLEGPDASKAELQDAQKWRDWVNERFVRIVTVNIYRTMKESFQAFDYITHNGNFNFLEKYSAIGAGAVAMYAISKRYLKKYNFSEEREELEAACKKWVEEGLNGKKFHGDKEPSLADLSVYGVITAVEDLDTFHEIMKNDALKAWYENMKSIVKSARIVD